MPRVTRVTRVPRMTRQTLISGAVEEELGGVKRREWINHHSRLLAGRFLSPSTNEISE